MEVIDNLINNITVLFIIAIPFIVFCYIITLALNYSHLHNNQLWPVVYCAEVGDSYLYPRMNTV